MEDEGPVAVQDGNQYAHRDTLAFDMTARRLGTREVSWEATGWCPCADIVRDGDLSPIDKCQVGFRIADKPPGTQ